MTPKLKIPKGWRRLQVGEKVRGTDRIRQASGKFVVLEKKWADEGPCLSMEVIIRRIPTPAKRAGKGRK